MENQNFFIKSMNLFMTNCEHNVLLNDWSKDYQRKTIFEKILEYFNIYNYIILYGYSTCHIL